MSWAPGQIFSACATLHLYSTNPVLLARVETGSVRGNSICVECHRFTADILCNVCIITELHEKYHFLIVADCECCGGQSSHSDSLPFVFIKICFHNLSVTNLALGHSVAVLTVCSYCFCMKGLCFKCGESKPNAVKTNS